MINHIILYWELQQESHIQGEFVDRRFVSLQQISSIYLE